MTRSHFIHPFLLALYPVLFLYSHNIDEVPFSQTLPALATTLGATLGLFLLLWLALRDSLKASCLLFLLLTLFFSYGYLYRGALELVLASFPAFTQFQHRHLMMLLGILFTYTCYRVVTVEKRANLQNFSTGLAAISVFLLLFPLFSIATSLLQSKRGEKKPKKNLQITVGKRPQKLPDVYYLVVERYAGEGTLRDIYDYDNGEFLHFLQRKGFYVAANSHANYLKTAHSLASSLNMRYINYLRKIAGKESRNWLPVYELLQGEHAVARFFRSQGYKLIQLGFWWDPTRWNYHFDVNYNRWPPEFSKALYKTTLLYPLLSQIGRRELCWSGSLYQFEKLMQIPEMGQPTFTFAHLMGVHEPYVFDSNGNFVEASTAAERSTRENYLNQLTFINKKLEQLIEVLLAKSEIPPIIILQADEGPFPSRYRKNWRTFDWRKATAAELQQKTGILNAYYFPGAQCRDLHPSITPVNSFRVLSNLYFGANLPLLPNNSYAHEDDLHIYEFFDITDDIAK